MSSPSTAYESHADLGGQAGYGAVTPEAVGDLFHAAWEPRVLALTLAMGATGAWNIDTSRAARETLPDYADLGYYAIWLGALEKLLLERGLLHPDELASGQASHAAPAVPRRLEAADVARVLATGAPTSRPSGAAPRFAVGAAVRTRAEPVAHHTRLPGYVRGKRGVVERAHGAHVFADSHAQGLGEDPQWLYTVVFEGAELWGEKSSRGLKVSIDAWEPYLEAV
ncbi:MAG: nitrile hydratase subunit beta [Burkholderiaceae bacterium]